MARMLALNPALRNDLQIYATSDMLGASLILTISAPVCAADIASAPDLVSALIRAGENASAAALLKRAGDWRLMTPEEVAEYRGRPVR